MGFCYLLLFMFLMPFYNIKLGNSEQFTLSSLSLLGRVAGTSAWSQICYHSPSWHWFWALGAICPGEDHSKALNSVPTLWASHSGAIWSPFFSEASVPSSPRLGPSSLLVVTNTVSWALYPSFHHSLSPNPAFRGCASSSSFLR